ncbi:MAG: mutM [Acidobacteria bacterium]|nr:mutM [Acidobacteriota bacterium]
MEGARFLHVDVRRPDLRTAFPPRFAARLKGRTVVRLDRRAKYLLAILSSDDTLVMHLGMSGSFRVDPEAAAVDPGKHDHVIFSMSSGFVVTFTDPRRFGFMDLLTPRQLSADPALSRLGPEPLSPEFDAAALARACRGKKTSLKAALLDQRVVAGLGNIYVSEALHLAHLSPSRRASTIATASGAPRPAAIRLAAAIKQVLNAAIARGAGAYRRGDRFRVYGRTGERCRMPRCGGTIAQRTQAGRTTFYCPTCQR